MAKKLSTLDAQIAAVAAGIRKIIKTDHQCTEKGYCQFDIAMFGQIAMRAFPHSTLDELGKAYEGMSWCNNAEKIING